MGKSGASYLARVCVCVCVFCHVDGAEIDLNLDALVYHNIV